MKLSSESFKRAERIKDAPNQRKAIRHWLREIKRSLDTERPHKTKFKRALIDAYSRNLLPMRVVKWCFKTFDLRSC